MRLRALDLFAIDRFTGQIANGRGTGRRRNEFHADFNTACTSEIALEGLGQFSTTGDWLLGKGTQI